MPRALLVGFFCLVLALAAGAYLLGRGGPEEAIRVSTSVAEAMGGDTAGYARAQAVRAFRFPDDHGPHPRFKTEWWYFTGNLEAGDGRHFGYQFTLFRAALAPPDTAAPVRRASGWATGQLYMAHFAVSDAAGNEHHAFERFSRGAAGLAGARAAPFRVWLDDWEARSAGEAFFPLRLRAATDEAAVDLVLRAGKPKVLQGEEGLSRKGPQPGNASYYYSFTRLPTTGTIAVGQDTSQVRGLSWMDREWSTSALSPGQQGWDWFALQLSDGRDLMYYQIRREDGTASPYSEGVLVGPEGRAQPIGREGVRLQVLDRWESPRGGTYPARWRLRMPSEGLDLEVVPYVADQELDVSVRYWEGAVRVRGEAGGQPVTGSGYAELTGYADSEQPGDRSGVLP